MGEPMSKFQDILFRVSKTIFWRLYKRCAAGHLMFRWKEVCRCGNPVRWFDDDGNQIYFGK